MLMYISMQAPRAIWICSVALHVISHEIQVSAQLAGGAGSNTTQSNASAATSSSLIDGCVCQDIVDWIGMFGNCSTYRLGGSNEGYCTDDVAELSCARSCGTCPPCGSAAAAATSDATEPVGVEVDMVLMMMVGVPLGSMCFALAFIRFLCPSCISKLCGNAAQVKVQEQPPARDAAVSLPAPGQVVLPPPPPPPHLPVLASATGTGLAGDMGFMAGQEQAPLNPRSRQFNGSYPSVTGQTGTVAMSPVQMGDLANAALQDENTNNPTGHLESFNADEDAVQRKRERFRKEKQEERQAAEKLERMKREAEKVEQAATREREEAERASRLAERASKKREMLKEQDSQNWRDFRVASELLDTAQEALDKAKQRQDATAVNIAADEVAAAKAKQSAAQQRAVRHKRALNTAEAKAEEAERRAEKERFEAEEWHAKAKNDHDELEKTQEEYEREKWEADEAHSEVVRARMNSTRLLPQ